MAISGSFYGTTSNSAIKPKITWSAAESIEGNYSDVTATLSYSRTDSYKTYGHWAGSLTVAGDTNSVSGKYVEITKNSNTVAITHTVRVPHNDDGTKTITISASGAISGTTLTKTTITASVTLTSIPRAASIAATDADIGSVSMVTIGKKSDIYSYTVAYQFGSLSGFLSESGLETEAVYVTASSLAFPLPESFYYEIPAKASDSCTLTCTTYLDGSAIGQQQVCTFTVRAAPAKCAPVLSVSVVDTNSATLALTGNKNIFIRYASTAVCTMTVQTRFGATVSKRKIAGKTVSGNTLTLTKVETDAVTFAVTDSRGYTTEKTLALELLPYFLPTLRIAATRTGATDGKAQLQITGSFYNGDFGLSANTLQLQYQIGSGDAVTVQPEIDGNQFTLQVQLQDLDYTQAYSVSVTATDALNTKTATTRINPGIPVFDWGKEDFNFHVPVNFSEGATGLTPGDITGTVPLDKGGTGATTAAAARANLGAFPSCVKVTTEGTSLDDYRSEGLYFFTSPYTPTNTPGGSNGLLIVFYANGYTRQLWCRFSTPGVTDHQIYIRSHISTTGWGSWAEILTTRSGGLTSITKLWENASPTSAFAAQSVSLDLSSYDGVMVTGRFQTTGTDVRATTGFVPVGQSGHIIVGLQTNANLRFRQFTVSQTGIAFETGYNMSSGAENTALAIPTVIYGIKGVTG